LAAYAKIDESEAPLIRISVVGPPDDENYPQYLAGMENAFRRQDQFGLVFDSGALGNLPARYRELQSAWLARTEGEFSGRWVCAAFVIQNRMIRGVLMTLFWINRPYYQHLVTSNVADAEEWARARLLERGALPKDASNG